MTIEQAAAEVIALSAVHLSAPPADEPVALPHVPQEAEQRDADPITHGGIDRGYKLCRCSSCLAVSRCTPMNDFYTRPNDEGGLLICELCVLLPDDIARIRRLD